MYKIYKILFLLFGFMNLAYASYDDYIDSNNFELNTINTQDSWQNSLVNKNLYLQKGNPQKGKEAYIMCAGCHLLSGSGKNDGSFPQLAGQHSSVIIKQIDDIKNGLRDNPPMYPFAAALTDNQKIIDIATYLEGLCQAADQGKYTGLDKKDLAEIGKNLYQDNCVECHKDQGQGDALKFYPKLAGQHYGYVLRELHLIQKNLRRNGNPDMIKLLQNYNEQQLKSLAVYISELPKIGKLCK